LHLHSNGAFTLDFEQIQTYNKQYEIQIQHKKYRFIDFKNV